MSKLFIPIGQFIIQRVRNPAFEVRHVPIIAGALAFGALTLITPREYKSEALLRIDANEAALLKTPRILDGPLGKSALIEQHGGVVSEARRTLLADHLAVSRQDDTGWVRLKQPTSF